MKNMIDATIEISLDKFWAAWERFDVLINGRTADLCCSDDETEEYGYLLTTDEEGCALEIYPSKVVFNTSKRYGFVTGGKHDYLVEFYEIVNPF